MSNPITRVDLIIDEASFYAVLHRSGTSRVYPHPTMSSLHRLLACVCILPDRVMRSAGNAMTWYKKREEA